MWKNSLAWLLEYKLGEEDIQSEQEGQRWQMSCTQCIIQKVNCIKDIGSRFLIVEGTNMEEEGIWMNFVLLDIQLSMWIYNSNWYRKIMSMDIEIIVVENIYIM